MGKMMKRPSSVHKSKKASRTKLGQQLRVARARIVAGGDRLLGWEEIRREVQQRRGGATGDGE